MVRPVVKVLTPYAKAKFLGTDLDAELSKAVGRAWEKAAGHLCETAEPPCGIADLDDLGSREEDPNFYENFRLIPVRPSVFGVVITDERSNVSNDVLHDPDRVQGQRSADHDQIAEFDPPATGLDVRDYMPPETNQLRKFFLPCVGIVSHRG